MATCLNHFNYTIIDSTVNGTTATVAVELTTIDFTAVTENVMREIEAYATSNDVSYMTEEEITAKVAEFFLNSFQNDVPLTTFTEEIPLSNDGDLWLPDDMYSLGYLITSGPQ